MGNVRSLTIDDFRDLIDRLLCSWLRKEYSMVSRFQLLRVMSHIAYD